MEPIPAKLFLQLLLLRGFWMWGPQAYRDESQAEQAACSPSLFLCLMDCRISKRRPGAHQLGGGCSWLPALGVLLIMLFGLKHKRSGGLAFHLLESFVLREKQTQRRTHTCAYSLFNLAFSMDRGQGEDVFPEWKAWLQTSSISHSLDRIQTQFVLVCLLGFRDVIWLPISGWTAAGQWPVASPKEDLLVSPRKHGQETASPGELSKQRVKDDTQITNTFWRKRKKTSLWFPL